MTPDELREHAETLQTELNTTEDALQNLHTYIIDVGHVMQNLQIAVFNVLNGLEDLEVLPEYTDNQVALIRQAAYRTGWDAAVNELTNRRYPAYAGQSTHPA